MIKQKKIDAELIFPSGGSWLSRAVDDPARFYFWPIVGRLYWKRVAMCLKYCVGEGKILEIGFGSGITFRTLNHRYAEIHGIDLHSPVDRLQRLFRDEGINCYLQNGSALELPYPDNNFHTVLLISILEHLTPGDVRRACQEICRVLKPGGLVVYGVPSERWFMRIAFWMFGYNIRDHHFSTEVHVEDAMREVFKEGQIEMLSVPLFGQIYQIGRFQKPVFGE